MDDVCWQLSDAGKTCEDTCGSLSAIDYRRTLDGSWHAEVVAALTARYNLGKLFWNSPPPPPSPPGPPPPPVPPPSPGKPPFPPPVYPIDPTATSPSPPPKPPTPPNGPPPIRPPTTVLELWLRENQVATSGSSDAVEEAAAELLQNTGGRRLADEAQGGEAQGGEAHGSGWWEGSWSSSLTFKARRLAGRLMQDGAAGQAIGTWLSMAVVGKDARHFMPGYDDASTNMAHMIEDPSAMPDDGRLVFADKLGAVCGVPPPPPPGLPPGWGDAEEEDEGAQWRGKRGRGSEEPPPVQEMYLFLPVASGWGCYKGEQPDEIDGYFRVPCVCKEPPEIALAEALEQGFMGAIVLFVVFFALGLLWDNMINDSLQRANQMQSRMANMLQMQQQQMAQMQAFCEQSGEDFSGGMPMTPGMPIMSGAAGGGSVGMGALMGQMGLPVQSWEEQIGELEAVEAKIELTVAAARDLPAMDKNALTAIGAQKESSDPYVAIEFGQRQWYTEVMPDTLYPVWEEEFTLRAESQLACLAGLTQACFPCCSVPQFDPDEEIVFTVYDQDNFSGDDAMGEVRLRLRNLIGGDVAEAWYPLTPVEGNLDVRGQLCLRWSVELKYGAGSAWKLRAFCYLGLQIAQLVTLGMTLVHFLQNGYYMYLFVSICIIVVVVLVSLMFTTSVSTPVQPDVGARVKVRDQNGDNVFGKVVATPFSSAKPPARRPLSTKPSPRGSSRGGGGEAALRKMNLPPRAPPGGGAGGVTNLPLRAPPPGGYGRRDTASVAGSSVAGMGSGRRSAAPAAAGSGGGGAVSARSSARGSARGSAAQLQPPAATAAMESARSASSRGSSARDHGSARSSTAAGSSARGFTCAAPPPPPPAFVPPPPPPAAHPPAAPPPPTQDPYYDSDDSDANIEYDSDDSDAARRLGLAPGGRSPPPSPPQYDDEYDEDGEYYEEEEEEGDEEEEEEEEEDDDDDDDGYARTGGYAAATAMTAAAVAAPPPPAGFGGGRSSSAAAAAAAAQQQQQQAAMRARATGGSAAAASASKSFQQVSEGMGGLTGIGGGINLSASGAYDSPRSGTVATGNFTVEIEVPACFTDRSSRCGGDSARAGGGSGRGSGRGSERRNDANTTNSAYSRPQHHSKSGGLGGRPPALAGLNSGELDYDSPGFVENARAGQAQKVIVPGQHVHMPADTGKPLMPYGCCTPVGLVAFAEVVRVLLPGGSSMQSNAELQGIFGTLRLVQALFLSAPLLYFQLWTMMLIEFPKVMEDHVTVLVSAVISYVAIVLALTAFVTSPATDRPCRVRGWLIHSKLISLGCLLYFAADIALRALAIAVIGYAMGAWTFILPPILLLLWAIRPLMDEARMLLSELGLGGGFSPGLPLFAYHEPPGDETMRGETTERGGVLGTLFSSLFCCCSRSSNGCCVRPVRVWLDTALQKFAFLMAPPVLDGLGTQPKRLFVEFLTSTLLCIALILLGLQPMMPHPQHDTLVIHWSVVAMALSTFLKAATFLWCFLPAMTGIYPVVGVSLVQWCDCMNWREEAEEMEEDVTEGTRKFMERQRRREMAASMH